MDLREKGGGGGGAGEEDREGPRGSKRAGGAKE